ncbi:MAG: hypothetical protein ABEN55_14010, partial [Bradymonadaceae bacterium]
RIVTVDRERRVPVIWDVTGSQVRARYGPEVGFGRKWALSPDGSVLAKAERDGSILLWDLRAGMPW